MEMTIMSFKFCFQEKEENSPWESLMGGVTHVSSKTLPPLNQTMKPCQSGRPK